MEVRQTNVRSFVNWCELEYRGAVQAKYVNSGFPKVLSDKDIRRKGVKREAFTQDELKAFRGYGKVRSGNGRCVVTLLGSVDCAVFRDEAGRDLSAPSFRYREGGWSAVLLHQ